MKQRPEGTTQEVGRRTPCQARIATSNPSLDPMTTQTPPATIGLLLSGGLDSAILLGHLLEQGHGVQPIFVRSQLAWEGEELRAVEGFLSALAQPRLAELVTLEMPLGDLYEGHWSITGQDTPDAASPDDAVYLPGRNPLLMIKAVVWCRLNRIEHLALGVLGTNPFADATPDFFDGFEEAMARAIRGRVRLLRPLAGMTKREVMQLGRALPLELTFSCIAPVDGLHCGGCNKCAERHAAFGLIAMDDPTEYAVPVPS